MGGGGTKKCKSRRLHALSKLSPASIWINPSLSPVPYSADTGDFPLGGVEGHTLRRPSVPIEKCPPVSQFTISPVGLSPASFVGDTCVRGVWICVWLCD